MCHVQPRSVKNRVQPTRSTCSKLVQKLAKNSWKWPNINDFFFLIFYFRHFFMDIFQKNPTKKGQKWLKNYSYFLNVDTKMNGTRANYKSHAIEKAPLQHYSLLLRA